MRSWLLAGVLFLSFSAAAAEFNGRWQGTLRYVTSAGEDEIWECNIDLISNAQAVVVDDADGCLSTSEYTTKYLIRGTELYEGGVHVGTISNGTLKFSTVGWDLSIQKTQGGGLSVVEKYVSEEGSVEDTFGVLGVRTTPLVHGRRAHKQKKSQH